MTQHTAYEAWKNFILVLSGVLAAEMFSSLGMRDSFSSSIYAAIEYYVTFDKWLWREVEGRSVQFIIVSLIIIYFLKCLHGFLVAIFSKQYYDHVKNNVLRSMFGLVVATGTILSLTFAPWYAHVTTNQADLPRASLAILGMLVLPTVTFIVLDFERYWGLPPTDRKMMIALRSGNATEFSRRLCAYDKEWGDVVSTWIVEDAFLILGAVGWITVMVIPGPSDGYRIICTLILLTMIPLFHGLIDYWLNRGFYFGFWHSEDAVILKVAGVVPPKTRRAAPTAPEAPVERSETTKRKPREVGTKQPLARTDKPETTKRKPRRAGTKQAEAQTKPAKPI